MDPYSQLEKRFARLHHLKHLGAIAHWDYAVMMPPGGSTARGAALAELEVIGQELISDPRVEEWLNAAENQSSDLSLWQKANLREMRREWQNANSISPRLLAAKSLAASECEHAWRSLRSQNNWRDFYPLLAKVVELAKEEALERASTSQTTPYDALLHIYEPFATSSKIDAVFAELKSFLRPFIDEVIEQQKNESLLHAKGPFAVEKQKVLGRQLMQTLGFDFEFGRLDESHHPFCGGVPHDVRVTSRYSEEDFVEGLMGILHETGHACYEQGLPKDWLAQPVGEARSMSVHESQSLLFEMQVSRSPEFLHFVAPLLQKEFSNNPTDQKAFKAENLARVYTRVKKGFIRVNADEVTYPLHVILRYEIEKDLIEGQLQTKDLPEVWNLKMTEYLGLSTLGNDKDGCMQDVHWPSGAFGYFPTYTLGALTAAQIFAAAKKSLPNLSEQVESGQFVSLLEWLRQTIWSKASLYPTDELLVQATGETLNPKYFENHLKSRYLNTN